MDTNNNWVIREFNNGDSLTQSFLGQISCDSYEDAEIKIKELKGNNPLHHHFEICKQNDSRRKY